MSVTDTTIKSTINGMIRHMMRYISSSPSRSTRSMVTSSPGRVPLFAVFARVLLGGVLRRRLAHRKIQEPRGVVADELPDGSPRHLQIEQDLRDAAKTIDRTLRTLQPEVGRQDRVVDAGHLDQARKISRAVLQGFALDEHADRMFHLDAARDQLTDVGVVTADDVGRMVDHHLLDAAPRRLVEQEMQLAGRQVTAGQDD